ncbi:MAG: 16S rRNA (uracil(1498)-N(3))-methyltransferase [Bacilli bacterium]|nr:16S rRNA (uracil(1498)-N(3))-methyltransferase [Bacilli bacterium]
MQRYFGRNINEQIILDEEDIFHITKVMRCKVGSQIEIVINNIVYLGVINSLNPFAVSIENELKNSRNVELDVKVNLYYCLPKGDKMDLVIQKCTELGVNSIFGVRSSRCIAKIENDKKKSKIDRFNKIMKEASEQSHRTEIPHFIDVIDYTNLKDCKEDYKFIAYELEAGNKNLLLTDLKNIKKGSSIAILIGSEGGFSTEEVKMANDWGFKNVSLGRRILRSETAAMYLMSVISFIRESN